VGKIWVLPKEKWGVLILPRQARSQIAPSDSGAWPPIFEWMPGLQLNGRMTVDLRMILDTPLVFNYVKPF
jgi:hypothetical protein